MLDFGAVFNAAAANDNKPTPQMLDQALLRAAEFGEDEKITDLIRRGAHKNARHTNNDTPLIIAAREGHAKTVRLLLRHRVDMSAQNNQGEDAASAARAAGHAAIAQKIESAIAAAATQQQKAFIAPIVEGSERDIPTLSLPRTLRRRPPSPDTPQS